MNELILKQAFDPYFEAPIEVWKTFADLCEEVHFNKNDKIKEAGKTEKYGYFLLEGACGLFIWKENHDVCLDLFIEPTFFTDDISLLSGKPSPIEIIALEKTKLLRMNKSTIESLKKTPMGSMLFLTGEQHAYVEKQQQQIDLLTQTAEKRYEELMEKNPTLVQRIAQKHIASFLGITTQSLSRIRKKYTNK